MREEMQRTVAEQLTQVVRALAGLEALDYELPRRVARRRADQGVPMRRFCTRTDSGARSSGSTPSR